MLLSYANLQSIFTTLDYLKRSDGVTFLSTKPLSVSL